jgi:hypothetical protein
MTMSYESKQRRTRFRVNPQKTHDRRDRLQLLLFIERKLFRMILIKALSALGYLANWRKTKDSVFEKNFADLL